MSPQSIGRIVKRLREAKGLSVCLLIALHEESARSQRKARKSQKAARDEINKRLEGKVVESFIDQLEQDEQTAGEPAPTDP